MTPSRARCWPGKSAPETVAVSSGSRRARRPPARGHREAGRGRPHGFATYLDYLRYCAASRGQAPGGKAPPWTMDHEHCSEADREFIQFYHRRMAWLSLRRYDKAVLDADHTLALMDFVRRHGNDDDYIASHEQFRGLVQFHRTQAQALIAIERRRPEEAIDALRDGMEKLGRPSTCLVGQSRRRLERVAQSLARRAASHVRAGDPQELRGREDPPRAAR